MVYSHIFSVFLCLVSRWIIENPVFCVYFGDGLLEIHCFFVYFGDGIIGNPVFCVYFGDGLLEIQFFVSILAMDYWKSRFLCLFWRWITRVPLTAYRVDAVRRIPRTAATR